uniref:BHLH domain-containing protein n=1 Tax=Strongyloides venezuelensis TaxID=75913 RepID=A0A0K0FIN7_STRVS
MTATLNTKEIKTTSTNLKMESKIKKAKKIKKLHFTNVKNFKLKKVAGLSNEEIHEMEKLRNMLPPGMNTQDPAELLLNVASYIGKLTTKVVEKVHNGSLPKSVLQPITNKKMKKFYKGSIKKC